MSILIAFLLCVSTAVGANAQTINDSTKTVKLGEVTVHGAEITIGQDKMTAYVSNSVKKHSYDGYSALQQMMMPGMDVDVFSAKISTYGESPVIAINGIQASTREVKTLNPKDLIRIDYYTGYNPNFPDAHYVIDFIVKVRESGGRTMLQATQNLNRPTGNDMIDWRAFGKTHEWGVTGNLDFNHYAKGHSSESTMWMVMNEGLVERNSTGWSTVNNYNSPTFTTYYIKRLKSGAFKATADIKLPHTREGSAEVEKVIYPGDRMEEERYSIVRHNDRSISSLHLYYDHKFSNKSKLILNATGTGSHTSDHRDRLAPNQSVYSTTKEDFQNVETSANYGFYIGEIHYAQAQIKYKYAHSDIDYTENSNPSHNPLYNSNAIVTVGDNMRFSSNVSLYSYIQWRYTYLRNKLNTDRQSFFTPVLRLSWRVSQGNSIVAQLETTSIRPELSMYSVEEKYIDRFMLRKGDPALRMQYRFAPQLTYTRARRWGMIDFQANYALTTHAIYIDVRRDAARNVYIQTFANGGNREKFNLKASLQYKLIPNCLQLRMTGTYSHIKIRTYTLLQDDSWQANASLTFMRNGFSGQLSALTPLTSMEEYGERNHTPAMLNLSLGYSYNGWNVSAECHNPFMKGCKETRLRLPEVTNIYRSDMRRNFNNYIALRISYAFNYGKTHKYETLETPDTENSAILPH